MPNDENMLLSLSDLRGDLIEEAQEENVRTYFDGLRKKQPKNTLRKILSVAAAFLLCTVITVSAVTGVSRMAENVDAAYPEVDHAVAAAADYSFDLFAKIAVSDGENKLVSPLSSLYCLGLVTTGADGNTRAQLEETFGMSADELNRLLLALSEKFTASDDSTVRIANSVWARGDENRLHLNDEFLKSADDWYGAEIFGVPFDDSTVREINDWCSDRTDGMIDRIVDNVSPDDVAYLINALSFDAKWEEQYGDHTVCKLPFTGYSGTKTEADMLSSLEETYLEMNGAEGFRKDYAGNDYSFVALLPDKGTDIYRFARSITWQQWLTMWEKQKSETVYAKVPEFSFENDTDLSDILKSLGVTDLFDPDRADLSKFGKSDLGNICVSKVKQKTFIELSQSGTKAAAVTSLEMRKTGRPADDVTGKTHEITLDRPFVFAIVDNATGLPLFLGIVAEL